MSTPAIRAALERLIELDKGIQGISGIPVDDWTDATAAARTALAQLEGEGEGPSNEELQRFYDESLLAWGKWRRKQGQSEFEVYLLRAALARWGRPTAPPAPAVVPVAVSERPWEREGWRDAEGRCWWGRPSEELCNSDWFLATRDEVEDFCSECMPIVSLPHNAIPLPQAGEVEA
jgi:hypothetical protein